MANNTWLRLYTEMPRDRKLRRLSVASRWIWVTILCMAKESPIPGKLYLSKNLPVTNEDIADEAGVPVEDVLTAVDVFCSDAFAMLSVEDGIISVLHWGERQYESDNSSARVQRHRKKQCNADVTLPEIECNVTETLHDRYSNADVTPPDTDTDTDTECLKEIESTGEQLTLHPEDQKEPTAKKETPVTVITELYSEILKRQLKLMPDRRKKAIQAAWKRHPDKEFWRLLFERAHASPFLNGDNDREWRADFDWMLNETNIAKVVEGKYDGKGGRSGNGRNENDAGGYNSLDAEWREKFESNIQYPDED